jgi:hypothetical protein
MTVTSIANLRHLVYRDLIAFLPAASHDQFLQFTANLSLHRGPAELIGDGFPYDEAVSAVSRSFINLRVTPDIAETAFRGFRPNELDGYFQKRYGSRLADVPGFYRIAGGSEWRLNLPERCLMHGYRDDHNFYAGVLYQPIDTLESYFLLSSAKYGGPKAGRLRHDDREFFDQAQRPAAVTAVRKFIGR